MELTTQQVLALAPDEASAAAGKKLAVMRHWKNLGRTSAALWGECQGSALYQVRVDLGSFAYGCTCPSRKLPCKHVLGLLLLAAGTPKEVPTAEPPQWIAEWLAKRAARAEKKQQGAERPTQSADLAAQAKRAAARERRVEEGLDCLDIWLADLVRGGLAGLETRPRSFWEDVARRLVDAQAPALAARVRRLAELPGCSQDWPRQLLHQLGRVALLSHAYRRLDQLDQPLQQDVRQLLGWTFQQDQLLSQGAEVVEDQWYILGGIVEEEGRLRSQRTWLLGKQTGRAALVWQFAVGTQPFSQRFPPAAIAAGKLVFWPGAVPQRAAFVGEFALRGAMQELPAYATIDPFLARVAGELARNPWLDRFLAVLEGVVVPQRPGPWRLCDATSETIPLAGEAHWRLLALSGGHPVTLAGEWDGERLCPLGAWAEGRYQPL
ncbi:MAG: SWIM zinc finger family protein [Pirellulales bacterium]|nr:SWIM zinc finger family protein [Pirellulales bacterium]